MTMKASRPSGSVRLRQARLKQHAPTGKLLFSGGITMMQGHEGANAGLDAVIDFLTLGKANLTQCPVYGCQIQSEISSDTQKDVP